MFALLAARPPICVEITIGPSDHVIACQGMIRATSASAGMFRLDARQFAAHGIIGACLLRTTLEAIPKDIPVLLDGLDETLPVDQVAQAVRRLGVSAVTGSDNMCGHDMDCFGGHIFLRCVDGKPSVFYQALGVAGSLKPLPYGGDWFDPSKMGLIAPDPESIDRIRAVAPEAWIIADDASSVAETLRRGRYVCRLCG